MLDTAVQNLQYEICAPQMIPRKDYFNSEIRAFRSKGKMAGRKEYRERINIIMQLMEQQQAEQALHFSLLVDNLLHKARAEFKLAFDESLADIPQHAEKLLKGKAAGRSEENLISVASQHRIRALDEYLRRALTKYLDCPVEECFINLHRCMQMPTYKKIKPINREYQMTLFLTENISKAMNKAYEEAVSACLPALLGKLAKKFDVGTGCLSMVDCHPKEQKARCLRKIEKHIQGLVKVYFLHFEHDLISTFVKTAYQLFDQVNNSRIAWKNEKILRRYVSVSKIPASMSVRSLTVEPQSEVLVLCSSKPHSLPAV